MDISWIFEEYGYYIIVTIAGILLYVNRDNDMFKF